ncbi:tetratricopeptide repeat protein [Oryzibacter oryziterrae]|uniref:tetratricopeptide repeat protein n=1 Tax=Oryzibacter oryziterrae TaxID=2766474 RepID=UPI001F003C21|nr:tetratricopeptide repeat protein [Oryzibacter oryziterrae]
MSAYLLRNASRRIALAALLGLSLVAGGCAGSEFEEGLLDASPDLSAFGASQAGMRAKAKDYFRQANYGLAERTFKVVVAKDPKDGEAWLGLAASYDRLGRFDLADQAYARVVAVSGRRGEVVNNMAWSQVLRGNRAQAKILFAEAVKLSPGNPVITANAAGFDKPKTAKS